MFPAESFLLSNFLTLSAHDVNRGEQKVIKQYLYKLQSKSPFLTDRGLSLLLSPCWTIP